MKKFAIVALLVLLVIIAGCVKAPVEKPAAAETSEDPQLDTNDVDKLSEDLSADDIEADLADLDPDELKDYDF